MSRFTSFDPNAELGGATAVSFLTNINHENIEQILKKHHLDDIKLDQWYPLQSVLNVMSDISEGMDYSANFVAIGLEAGVLGTKMLPPSMANMSIAEFMVAYEQIYHTRHRGNAGYLKTEQLSDSHVRIVTCMPYPDDVCYGVFFAYARHFCPPNKRFTIVYDTDHQNRDDGGAETIYHIYIK